MDRSHHSARLPRLPRICLIAVLVCLLVLTGCRTDDGPTLFARYEAVKREVFQIGRKQGVTYFEAVSYSVDFNTVTELDHILQFSKQAGYTREDLEDQTYRATFPDFSVFEVFDDGDTWTLLIRMEQVNELPRLLQLVEKGLISPGDGNDMDPEFVSTIGADYYMESILHSGGREATPEEIATLHLP